MFTGRERIPSHPGSASGDRGILHSLPLAGVLVEGHRRALPRGIVSGCPATAVATGSASRRLLLTFTFFFALCLFLRLRVDLLS